MAHITADRVKDTTTTTGTGSLTLANAAPTGFRTLDAVAATNDTFFYAVEGGSEWEVGLGTYSGSHVFARTTVLASSNSNAAVSFSAGTKNFFITLPASKIADNTAYASSWDADTATAPSRNAVYDKFEAFLFPRAPISNNYAILQHNEPLVTSGSGSADTIYAAPFIVPRRITITQLGFAVVTGSATNGQVAIYPDASGVPGATATVATGNLSMASNVAVLETLGSALTIDPGIYWACINRSGTATFAALGVNKVTPLSSIVGYATITDLMASASTAPSVAKSVARTFGTWGDLSGLGWAAASSAGTGRVPALLVKFQ